MLIEGLPPESRLKAAMADEIPLEDLKARTETAQRRGYGRWTREALLLAELIDVAQWQLFAASDGKGTKPAPYPRPGVPQPGVVTPEIEAVYERLEAERAAHRARRIAAGLDVEEVPDDAAR